MSQYWEIVLQSLSNGEIEVTRVDRGSRQPWPVSEGHLLHHSDGTYSVKGNASGRSFTDPEEAAKYLLASLPGQQRMLKKQTRAISVGQKGGVFLQIGEIITYQGDGVTLDRRMIMTRDGTVYDIAWGDWDKAQPFP